MCVKPSTDLSSCQVRDRSSPHHPLDGLAKRYLGDIMCPRIYRGRPEMTRQEEIGERFSYIKDLAKEFNVNGAIVCIL